MKAYTYVVLRYVHDTTTGECLNLGVILHADGFTASRFRTDYTRILAAFPDANAQHLRDVTQHISKSLSSASSNAMDLAKSTLPRDDSSLQWSPMGAGRAPDLEQALAQLFDRMVR